MNLQGDERLVFKIIKINYRNTPRLCCGKYHCHAFIIETDSGLALAMLLYDLFVEANEFFYGDIRSQPLYGSLGAGGNFSFFRFI